MPNSPWKPRLAIRDKSNSPARDQEPALSRRPLSRNPQVNGSEQRNNTAMAIQLTEVMMAPELRTTAAS